MEPIKYEEVERKIVVIRGENILLDGDVAQLYGVETKRVNEAVNNNPEKFPEGYILKLETEEWNSIRSKISTLKQTSRGSHTKYRPKAFTEKGLYMLATILKSPQATYTTIAIIEAFSKLKDLSKNMKDLAVNKDESQRQALIQKSGEIFTEIFSDELVENESETSIELNFAVLKFKHTIKRKKEE